MHSHLPFDCSRIARQQGWNEHSLIIHLIGFIQEQGPIAWEQRLEGFFEAIAAEENSN